MAYIGRNPAYGSFEKQALTPNSSTTSFALTYVVGSSSSILVSIAGVVQEPEVAYNISGGGANIVFTAAPTTDQLAPASAQQMMIFVERRNQHQHLKISQMELI